jgi:hypothetical protein
MVVNALSWLDCDAFVHQIREAGLDPVVVGGQALNAWIDYFAESLGSQLLAVASKDLDLVGSTDDARKAAQALGLQFKPINARKAAIRLNAVLLSEDSSLRIDFLPGSPPNADNEVQEAAVSLPTKWGSVRVMHPLHCLRSRVYNVLEAHVDGEKKYDNERGLTQMRASREILECFLAELIETEKGPRKVLKIQEALFEFALSERGLRVWHAKQFDVFTPVSPRPALGEAFGTKRYPQMVEQLTAARQV